MLVSVLGTQTFADGDGREEIKTESRGTYYQKNGAHYVLYEEHAEGADQPIKTRLILRGGELRLSRSGYVCAELFFAAGKKNQTAYRTPFGEMTLTTHTSALEITESRDELRILVYYGTEMNGAYLADAKLEMRISSLI